MENKVEQSGVATIDVAGKSIELPVFTGTLGADVIDVRSLYAKAGMFTLDPGFTSTASCESQITFVDGENGILLYRGYPIEDLAEHCDHLEVCYLLLHGELPNKDQFEAFQAKINNHTLLHSRLDKFIDNFPLNSHPMAMMTSTVGALAAFYPDLMDITNSEERWLSTHRLIAKMITLAGRAYKHSVGQPFVQPQNSLSYAENFLNMCFSVPAEPYDIDPVVVKAMNRLLILQADHEQNASTSTVRLAGSSGAHPFAAVASGIASLWGPSHGGANEACLAMLNEIGDVKNIPEFIGRAKDKNDPFRLMGFGHRVYKNYDPRAKVMQQTVHELMDSLNIEDNSLLQIAVELEKIALEDDYFVERKLYPNVDFYSGLAMEVIGFPREMFTVLFALGRTTGWVAQLNEMIQDQTQRIGRPRQIYTGMPAREFVALENR